MKEIFEKFLWGGPKQQRKWALVSWKNVMKRKEEEGLGMRDPEMLNKVLGAKLWWRWLKEPKLPWAKHWKEKYAQNHRLQNLIGMQETPKGSPIWNLGRNNQHIVQEQSFWEVRDGKTTLF